MVERTVRETALAYVVDGGRLLVLRHVDVGAEDVGLQVPGGGVRAGETPEAAVLREAREETDLRHLAIVRKLGETEYDITPYRFEIQHRHVFHLRPTSSAPTRWAAREDHDGRREPTRLECFWIPLESAHVLQAGQGALIGRLYEPDRGPATRSPPGPAVPARAPGPAASAGSG